jgi:DNA-binding YbaB/EbfC family protein
MAKGMGFPPMGGNMNNIMKQAQKLQKQIEESKEQVESKTVEASAGGGAVTAVVSGKKQVIEIKINPDVVDPDDVEMLQDLVLAAINEALNKAEQMVNEEMAKVTGGFNIPGLF